MTQKNLYQCPRCGLHYRYEQTAKECQAFCKAHNNTCSLEISQKSVEAEELRKKAQNEG